MTDLAARMALHTAGQVTWPEPDIGQTCDQCQHYDTENMKTAGKGRCWLVKAHQGIEGKSFEGAKATACPQFRGLA